MKTIEQLMAQATEIKNATQPSSNTATRVGGQLLDTVEFIDGLSQELNDAQTALTLHKAISGAFGSATTAHIIDLGDIGAYGDNTIDLDTLTTTGLYKYKTSYGSIQEYLLLVVKSQSPSLRYIQVRFTYDDIGYRKKVGSGAWTYGAWASKWESLGADLTALKKTVYVAGTNGSDSNDGLSQGTALRNINRALSLYANNTENLTIYISTSIAETIEVDFSEKLTKNLTLICDNDYPNKFTLRLANLDTLYVTRAESQFNLQNIQALTLSNCILKAGSLIHSIASIAWLQSCSYEWDIDFADCFVKAQGTLIFVAVESEYRGAIFNLFQRATADFGEVNLSNQTWNNCYFAMLDFDSKITANLIKSSKRYTMHDYFADRGGVLRISQFTGGSGNETTDDGTRIVWGTLPQPVSTGGSSPDRELLQTLYFDSAGQQIYATNLPDNLLSGTWGNAEIGDDYIIEFSEDGVTYKPLTAFDGTDDDSGTGGAYAVWISQSAYSAYSWSYWVDAVETQPATGTITGSVTAAANCYMRLKVNTALVNNTATVFINDDPMLVNYYIGRQDNSYLSPPLFVKSGQVFKFSLALSDSSVTTFIQKADIAPARVENNVARFFTAKPGTMKIYKKIS
ncbi:MAG: hypothetical protein LBS54_04095 [Dysgonamonadaceae bacterium]|nr:hypothetical protein [Dysgonamonadaceae bacterium]